MLPIKFTEGDAETAYKEWGCNCGPTAIAAICGLTLEGVRPHLGDFPKKHYTNPTLMWRILDSIGVRWKKFCSPQRWPSYGLSRVQWEGPWTAPGVPPMAAYWHTHWVGVKSRLCTPSSHRLSPTNAVFIFDINAMNYGGWVSLSDWSSIIVPHILKLYPKASGGYHLTHSVEIEEEAVCHTSEKK